MNRLRFLLNCRDRLAVRRRRRKQNSILLCAVEQLDFFACRNSFLTASWTPWDFSFSEIRNNNDVLRHCREWCRLLNNQTFKFLFRSAWRYVIGGAYRIGRDATFKEDNFDVFRFLSSSSAVFTSYVRWLDQQTPKKGVWGSAFGFEMVRGVYAVPSHKKHKTFCLVAHDSRFITHNLALEKMLVLSWKEKK